MEKNKDRVRHMDALLNEASALQSRILEDLERLKAFEENYRKLRAYYGSAEMEEDIDAEEAGKLSGINRAVLSQDALYDVIGERYRLGLEFLAAAQGIFEQW